MKVFSAVVALLFASSAAGEYDGIHLLYLYVGVPPLSNANVPWIFSDTYFLSFHFQSKQEFPLINL